MVSIDHKWVAKRETFDDVMQVMVWSLRQAALGIWPGCRHDGSAWTNTDVKRKGMRAASLELHGVLCQITGGWKMYKDIFRLPPAQ